MKKITKNRRRIAMNKKVIALAGVFSLLGLIVLAAPGLCQGAGNQPAAQAKPAEASKVTLKGKVVFNQKSGNHMFRQEEPPYSDFFIMNENIDDLKALSESQKIVTVEGSLPQGADLLRIDTIDGKKFGNK
jgi:hypothetical protein